MVKEFMIGALWKAVKSWGWDWIFLIPMAAITAGGFGLFFNSWQAWIYAFLAGIIYEATIPLWA